MRKSILFAIFALIFSASSAQTPLTEAVDFTAKDIDGNTQHLFDYLDAGNYVVLDFYFTTCSSCQETTTEINQSYLDFGCNTNNVIFIGINVGNSATETEAYKTAYGINFPSIAGIDGGSAITSNYSVATFPTKILIAPNHSIIKQDIWSAEPLTLLIEETGGILSPCVSSALTTENSTNSKSESQTFDLEKDIKIYPNPTSSNTYVALDENISLQYFDCFVSDLSGKIITVPVEKENTGLYRMDMSQLTKGLYFMTVMVNNEKSTRKIAVN